MPVREHALDRAHLMGHLEIHYFPAPAYGGLDYAQMGVLARLMRTVFSLRAPFLTARPKRLTAQGR